MNPFLSDAVVIAVIGGIVSVITTRISVQSKKHTNEILNRLDEMTEKIHSLQIEVSETREIGLDNRDGIQKTQRFRLYDSMSQEIYRGFTTTENVREFGKLYESYTNLGGNGEIHDLHDVYLQLPIQSGRE